MNKKYLIWLSRIENLGTKKILNLLSTYSLEQLWNLTESELKRIPGIGQETAKKIRDDKYRNNLDKYLEYMEKNQIQILNLQDQSYPKNLKNIYDPPFVLYVKGNLQILNEFSLGIIGCRAYSEYGKETALRFSYELSQSGINIISGLAKRSRYIFSSGLFKRKI